MPYWAFKRSALSSLKRNHRPFLLFPRHICECFFPMQESWPDKLTERIHQTTKSRDPQTGSQLHNFEGCHVNVCTIALDFVSMWSGSFLSLRIGRRSCEQSHMLYSIAIQGAPCNPCTRHIKRCRFQPDVFLTEGRLVAVGKALDTLIWEVICFALPCWLAGHLRFVRAYSSTEFHRRIIWLVHKADACVF